MNPWTHGPKTGLVVGNACLAAAVSARGRMFQRIQWNPPCFEEGQNGLVSGGESGFFFRAGGQLLADESLSWQVLENDYPRYRAKAQLAPGLWVEAAAWAPLASQDPEPMFLPVVCATLRFTAQSPCALDVGFSWEAAPEMLGGSYEAAPRFFPEEGWIRAEKGQAFAVLDGGDSGWAQDDPPRLSLWTRLQVKASRTLRCWFGCFPPKQRWRSQAGSIKVLCEKVRNDFSRLEQGVSQWIEDLPSVGDSAILRYTKWYSQAAVLLTKADCEGRVITMGYKELNQRDSFWTSYVHLYYWPGLEKRMIEESCQWQREDGKVPTTFLPVYERERDLDINEYFCLRIGRYYRAYADRDFLRECWPHYLLAVDFLLSRDLDGDGLPEQAPPEDPLCFWADWKDVQGVVGRKLAPHFTLLWLAVLQEGRFLADALGDQAQARRFAALFEQALALANRSPEEGGLWQDGCYREVWYNGQTAPYALIDQTVGIAFGVVDGDRTASILHTLDQGETPAGIPETWPFRPQMEYAPGVYHNGGIWPFLTFCDCLGRYRTGRWRQAERLIRKIGLYDLEVPGDWAPNEYLHGITLENCGYEIQGWSAALFGALTHGAFQVRRLSEGETEVQVNFPERDFSTALLLPEPFGRVRLWRQNGILGHEPLTAPGLRLSLREGFFRQPDPAPQ